jgi:hypothetical protein
MADQTAFDGASIELFTRLWAELEAFAAEIPHQRKAVVTAFVRRLQTLRLELIVLLDACRFPMRVLLDDKQRHALERCFGEVLECLNTRFDEAPLGAAGMAKNCRLDSVLEHHGMWDDRPVSRMPRRGTGRIARAHREVAVHITGSMLNALSRVAWGMIAVRARNRSFIVTPGPELPVDASESLPLSRHSRSAVSFGPCFTVHHGTSLAQLLVRPWRAACVEGGGSPGRLSSH